MLQRASRWFPWLLGALLFAGVIAFAFNASSPREFLELARRAQPLWLALAGALQAATYAAQAEVWCLVAARSAFRLSRGLAYELSLAKLFVDQALPSAGMSGTALFASAVQRRGMPRSAVMAGVVIDSVSFHATYLACLATALLIATLHHRASRWVWMIALVFALLRAGLIGFMLAFSGRRASAWLVRLAARVPAAAAGLHLFEVADAKLARRPELLLRAAACQLAIFVLDAATLSTLIRALGTDTAFDVVFASFMFSTMFRTLGFFPGGLGSFEASSVLTLHLVGVPVPVALSATLLFRGLSFWLPMLPGLVFSRRALRVPLGQTQRGASTTDEHHWQADRL